MPRHEAVVLHRDDTRVVVVQRREVQRVAHHHAPVLPTGLLAVVVVLVATGDMGADVLAVVVIDGTALVFRVQILHDDVLQPGQPLQVQVESQHIVFQVVHEEVEAFFLVPVGTAAVAVVVEQEHAGVVFKIVVEIEGHAPRGIVEAQPPHPAAYMVATGILIDTRRTGLAGIGTPGNEGMDEGFQVAGVIIDNTAIIDIGSTAKLACHLQAQFQRDVLRTNAQIGGLRVVEGVLHILALAPGEVALPAGVGLQTVGNVAFQRQPLLGVRHRPVVGQSQAHLRNGAGIDA